MLTLSRLPSAAAGRRGREAGGNVMSVYLGDSLAGVLYLGLHLLLRGRGLGEAVSQTLHTGDQLISLPGQLIHGLLQVIYTTENTGKYTY